MKTPILPLVRPTVFFALLLALLAGVDTCAKPLAKITVEAGKHTRIDTPVSVELDGISYRLLGLQEIKGSQRLPVPTQVEPGNPPRLDGQYNCAER